MAIKPVEVIPDNPVDPRTNRREHLRADLLEAHKAGPGKYELTGDYNYTYLRQYAREQEEYLFRVRFAKICKEHRDEWKERFQWDSHYFSDWEFRKLDNVVIHAVKCETKDKTRVFIEVTETDEENERRIVAACEEAIMMDVKRQKEREERRKLKMVVNEETKTIDFVVPDAEELLS